MGGFIVCISNSTYNHYMDKGYNYNNYWVFGLCPSSGIQKTREHKVSETGSVSVLRWGRGETPTLFGPLDRA
jgi:hypothetical protein